MKTNLNRREFLNATGTALTAAVLASQVEGQAAPAVGRRTLKKAITWGCIGGKYSVAEKFRIVKEAGFDGVEPDSHMNRTEVLRARDAVGLETPSVCDSLNWGKTLTDPDPAVRAAGLAGLKVALHDAKTYGATSVLLVPGVVNATVTYAQAYERSKVEILKAIPLAEELGVRIATENVWNNFILSPIEAARYVDDFLSPAMGWHFDIGNSMRYGWPEQWIPILRSRIAKLHIKEFSRTKMEKQGLWAGFDVDYLDGDNNWPAIMQSLRNIGYNGWAIAEPAYTPPGVDVPTRMHQIVEKMDKLLAM